MAWLPISGTVPQYSTINNNLAADYYLKFYASGTTTPINMATDATGATELAKCALSDGGYPITNPLDDSTRFIPHIDQDYRIVLYTNEDDADDNNTSAAAFNIDGMVLQVVPTASAEDVSIRDTNMLVLDDYDRSPWFTDGDGFTAGAGPHVITVPSDWTPTDADMRFYRLDNSGIVTELTPTSTSSTTFTLTETLLSTDTIFIGDDEFRSQIDGFNELLERSSETFNELLSQSTVTFAELLEGSLPTYTAGWSLKVAEYSGEFSVSSQDSAPRDVVFNDDGSKMFIIGSSNDTVYAYDLSTDYDISTATYNGENFSVASQETAPQSIAFSGSGDKMFTSGGANQTIYAYDLGTDFDVSTAVYNGENFDVSGQDVNAAGLAFNNDGSKVFMAGPGSDKVYAYDLSTNYDVSTATYNGENFDVLPQDGGVVGVAFSSSGDKMIIMGGSNQEVYAYYLSTNYDVSTAVYCGEALDVSYQETSPQGVAFSSNGSVMVIVGSDSDAVHSFYSSFLRI